MTSARTTRANSGLSSRPITRITLKNDGPAAATTASARTMEGNTRIRSNTRMTISSKPAAAVAGEQAHGHAHNQAEQHGGNGDAEGPAGAGDHAGEHVHAVAVGAE